MIVLHSPKGWTGPKIVDGKQIEATFRAHQMLLRETLHGTFHELRQSGIDEELVDVISGFEARSSRGPKHG